MKKILAAALSLCMALGVTSCTSGAPTSGSNTSPVQSGSTSTGSTVSPSGGAAIKIGGIGPTTGGAAVYGVAVKNGAELAIKEINAMGATQYEMNFQDDEHDPEKAVNAYNQLKDWGMQILMGTVTSGPCIAVAEESYRDSIFQLTPSGSAVDCIKYDNAFRVCFSDPNQGFGSAKYIGESKIATKIGVIYDSSDPYSSGIFATFAEEAKNQGLEIVAKEAFTADSNTDFSVQLNKIKSSGAELVFLPIYYKEASLILTQASKMDFKPIFLGCDGLDGLLAVKNFDIALAEGVMLLTPFAADAQDDLTKNFVASYKAAYGEIPNQFAADAYDAIYAIDAACKMNNVTAQMSATDICTSLKDAFVKISIDGLTGDKMTWSVEGEPNKAPRAVKIVNGVYTAM